MDERMRKLQAMLEKQPNDPFLLYAIALEHKKAGQAAEAIGYLDRVVRADPGYCYAYHQKGLICESTGDFDAARRSYREGMEAAARKGDLHAKGEIEAALEMLGNT
jgi:Flp pilus assembly protein TadD